MCSASVPFVTLLRMIVNISQAIHAALILSSVANQDPIQWHHGHT